MNKTAIILLMIAAALLFAVAGALIGLRVGEGAASQPSPLSLQENTCKLDPRLEQELAEIKAGSTALKAELESLKQEIIALSQAVAALQGSTEESSEPLREQLPGPYVAKVDEFFQSSHARALLSPKAGQDAAVVFGKPIFVSQDLINVPYKFRNKYYYLLVKISILDYYDLRFDVLWDSLEGEK